MKKIIMTETLSEVRQVFRGETEYELDDVKADQFVAAGIAKLVIPTPTVLEAVAEKPAPKKVAKNEDK